MKNLIVQINVPGELYKDSHLSQAGPGTYGIKGKGYSNLQKIGKESERSFRLYAKKCNADYVVFEKPVYNWVSPSFERMRLIVEDKWANLYDNVLYVDYDILCHPKASNVFLEYPQDAIRIVNKKNLNSSNKEEMRNFRKRGVNESIFRKTFFNAGVMLFNKRGMQLLKKYEKFKKRVWSWRHGCQGEMNFCIMKHKIPVIEMDGSYNKLIHNKGGSISHLWKNTNFFHFVGGNSLPPNSQRVQILNKIKEVNANFLSS